MQTFSYANRNLTNDYGASGPPRLVSSSLWLLVRFCTVYTRSFLCPPFAPNKCIYKSICQWFWHERGAETLSYVASVNPGESLWLCWVVRYCVFTVNVCDRRRHTFFWRGRGGFRFLLSFGRDVRNLWDGPYSYTYLLTKQKLALQYIYTVTGHSLTITAGCISDLFQSFLDPTHWLCAVINFPCGIRETERNDSIHLICM